ncbi:hypothetical protein BDV97DRAFT_215755 [Delphinella strobiligena]|nr:hypothetical protein BDV97DRAFT_215755 [Delphinella strobiligena]
MCEPHPALLYFYYHSQSYMPLKCNQNAISDITPSLTTNAIRSDMIFVHLGTWSLHQLLAYVRLSPYQGIILSCSTSYPPPPQPYHRGASTRILSCKQNTVLDELFRQVLHALTKASSASNVLLEKIRVPGARFFGPTEESSEPGYACMHAVPDDLSSPPSY